VKVLRQRLEEQQQWKDEENLDPVTLTKKLDEAEKRRQTHLEERQAHAAVRSQMALERQYLKEAREEIKRLETLEALEKKTKAAEDLKALLDTRKQAVAWKLAGGEVQGKKAREALVDSRRDDDAYELEQKIKDRLDRAAANKAAEDARKASSAKKKESRKVKVEQGALEQARKLQKDLERRQAAAESLAAQKLTERVLKAKLEHLKGDQVRAAKKSSQNNNNNKDFFRPPHEDDEDLYDCEAACYQPSRAEEPAVVVDQGPPRADDDDLQNDDDVKCRLYPRESIVDVDSMREDKDESTPNSSGLLLRGSNTSLLLRADDEAAVAPPPTPPPTPQTTNRPKESCYCFAFFFSSPDALASAGAL